MKRTDKEFIDNMERRMVDHGWLEQDTVTGIRHLAVVVLTAEELERLCKLAKKKVSTTTAEQILKDLMNSLTPDEIQSGHPPIANEWFNRVRKLFKRKL